MPRGWNGTRSDGGRPWQRLRAEVVARDRSCRLKVVCAGAPSETAHHVVPVSRGGSHDLSNLIGACHACNRAVAVGEAQAGRRTRQRPVRPHPGLIR